MKPSFSLSNKKWFTGSTQSWDTRHFSQWTFFPLNYMRFDPIFWKSAKDSHIDVDCRLFLRRSILAANKNLLEGNFSSADDAAADASAKIVVRQVSECLRLGWTDQDSLQLIRVEFMAWEGDEFCNLWGSCPLPNYPHNFQGSLELPRERGTSSCPSSKPILLELGGTWNVTRKANKTWCSPCISRNLWLR